MNHQNYPEQIAEGIPDHEAEQEAELELAVAELAFWLDFAKWWRGKHCGQEDPRIPELLAQAEHRYLRAKAASTDKKVLTEPDLSENIEKSVH